MSRRAIAVAIAAVLSVATASFAVAADPAPTGHGAEVSAVAKAVKTTQGNAHGKAVSAIASAHGKQVSAAAKAKNVEKRAAATAKAAEKRAAAKAKAAEKSNGKSTSSASPSAAAASDPAPTEELPSAAQPGGVKAQP
jgi:colicin import membrane protein